MAGGEPRRDADAGVPERVGEEGIDVAADQPPSESVAARYRPAQQPSSEGPVDDGDGGAHPVAAGRRQRAGSGAAKAPAGGAHDAQGPSPSRLQNAGGSWPTDRQRPASGVCGSSSAQKVSGAPFSRQVPAIERCT